MSDRVEQQGATSLSIDILIRDRTTGHAKTGLVAADITAYYARPKTAPVPFATSDLATIGAAFAAGGFKEYSAADAPGLYRLDIPNGAASAPAIKTVVIGWHGALIEDDIETISLVPFDISVVDKTGFKLANDGMDLVPGYV
jgi:hypothetical protein